MHFFSIIRPIFNIFFFLFLSNKKKWGYGSFREDIFPEQGIDFFSPSYQQAVSLQGSQ